MTERPSEEWSTLSEILSSLPKGSSLYSWQKKNPRWYEDSNRGREISNQVREYAMILATGRTTGHLPTDAIVVQNLISFFSWASQNKPQIIAADMPVWSGAYRFRTNLDLLYQRDDTVWLSIVTTAKKIGVYHHARIAAIRFAICEMICRQTSNEWRLRFPEKMSILRLQPSTEAKPCEEVETEGNFEIFERAYRAYV